MLEKPVNQIDLDSNIIKANDINSVINIKITDVNNNPVNLENEIEYFYMVRNDKYYPVTDISFKNGGISFKLPNLYKGLYKIEIKDKKGSIYPANDDISILLNQSFENGKESEFINMKDSILKDVPEIVTNYINNEPERFKGDPGERGYPGRKGEDGKDGLDGKDGKDAIIPDDILNIVQNFDEEYLIPSDFETIQTALNELSVRNIKQGKKINLLIESGHKLNTPINLNGGNYSQFYISSIDPIVSIDDTFPKTIYAKFESCTAPILNTLIDGKGYPSNGFRIDKASSFTVNPGCGFINAGSTNLYVNGSSTAYVSGGIFTGASQDSSPDDSSGGAGITSWGSMVFAENCDVSGSNRYGVQAAHGGVVSFRNGKADNSSNLGVRATNNARIDARGATANDCGTYGVLAIAGGFVSAYSMECKNAGTAGIYAVGASTVLAYRADVSGSTIGILAERSSTVEWYLGVAVGCETYAISATESSTVNGFGVIIEDTGTRTVDHGVNINKGSTVTLSRGTITGSAGSDVRINKGSTANLDEAKTTNSTEWKPMIQDVNATSFNTVSSFGIIYG